MTDHVLDPNPYSPPNAASTAGAANAGATGAAAGASVMQRGRRAGKIALKLLGAVVLLFVLSTMVAIVHPAPMVGRVAYGLVTLAALMGVGSAVVSLVQLAFTRPLPGGFTAGVVFALLGNGFMMLLGALAAFLSTAKFSRGRQLRSFGRVLLPKVRAEGAWAAHAMDVAVDDEVRPALAAQWRENGRTEHASVAAFARLTLDLMALGAPPDLVASANRDALDEIRHTELCFSLARAIDGKSESPGPFPEAQRARTLPGMRSLALAQLAVDSLVDGALHEGISARVIAKLARRAEDPRIAAILKEIAADEGRHSAHGWDVVTWCLAEGGDAVANALVGALAALPRSMETPLPRDAEGGGWERFGIVGRALEAREFAKARAELERRVIGMLAQAGAGESVRSTRSESHAKKHTPTMSAA